MEKLILNKFPDTRKAPVRAQGLPGHVRPSLNSTAPSSCAFIFKTCETGQILGQRQRRRELPWVSNQGMPCKTYNKSFSKCIYCFPLEAQSTQPCPAQLSISLSSPGELGRATLP